ncbi:MAG: class I SAM-dependent methyltransferase [Armatimonadota bacterium]|nr:class I SAM-dependent methyltransferase [Armatimonadota bacterium]
MARREPINDLDLTRWHEYSDLLTDSLWLLGKRDNSGVHRPDYWGNFAPQIPYQAMRRFTQQGELVLDPFVGMGTTLIEALRLGRHAIGVELNPTVVQAARERIAQADNSYAVRTALLQGDSTHLHTAEQVRCQMSAWGFQKAHLLIFHPPYHDIIPFSDHPRDLSNAPTVEAFLTGLEQSVALFAPLLEVGRFLVLVIGDKYAEGEWVPLGFYSMERVRKHGFRLKSICVKDFHETRGKRGQRSLWRYRALKGNFYVFAHEYVMFFEKQQ